MTLRMQSGVLFGAVAVAVMFSVSSSRVDDNGDRR